MSGSRDNIPEESKVQGDRVRTVKSNKQPKDKVSPSKELLSRIVAQTFLPRFWPINGLHFSFLSNLKKLG